MRPLLPSFVLCLALSAPAVAEVDVRVEGGRVNVRTLASPLGDVLDRVAQQTGMKVVYEGPRPTMIVAASVEGATPPQAVVGILEGLGLTYVMRLDRSGGRVETLLMITGASSSSPKTAGMEPPPPGVPMPPGMVAGPEMMEEEPEEVEPEPEEAPAKPQGDERPAGPFPPAPFPGAMNPAWQGSPFAPKPGMPGMAPPGVPLPPGGVVSPDREREMLKNNPSRE